MTDPQARRAIVFGVPAMRITVAGFGIYEVMRGFAASGLWSAIGTENIMALALLFSLRAQDV